MADTFVLNKNGSLQRILEGNHSTKIGKKRSNTLRKCRRTKLNQTPGRKYSMSYKHLNSCKIFQLTWLALFRYYCTSTQQWKNLLFIQLTSGVRDTSHAPCRLFEPYVCHRTENWRFNTARWPGHSHRKAWALWRTTLSVHCQCWAET